MKKILIIFIFIFMLCGCKSNYDIKKIMEENDYVIVDVRTKEEYEQSHIKDSINISYEEIEKINDLYKDKIIFVYCKSGRRSKIAYDKLIKLGYKVYDLGSIDDIDLPKK